MDRKASVRLVAAGHVTLELQVNETVEGIGRPPEVGIRPRCQGALPVSPGRRKSVTPARAPQAVGAGTHGVGRHRSNKCSPTVAPGLQLERLAATIQTWWACIEAFLHTQITNAKGEGCNRVVKLDARNAYGYRNPANQRLRTRCATTRRARGCLEATVKSEDPHWLGRQRPGCWRCRGNSGGFLSESLFVGWPRARVSWRWWTASSVAVALEVGLGFWLNLASGTAQQFADAHPLQSWVMLLVLTVLTMSTPWLLPTLGGAQQGEQIVVEKVADDLAQVLLMSMGHRRAELMGVRGRVEPTNINVDLLKVTSFRPSDAADSSSLVRQPHFVT